MSVTVCVTEFKFIGRAWCYLAEPELGRSRLDVGVVGAVLGGKLPQEVGPVRPGDTREPSARVADFAADGLFGGLLFRSRGVSTSRRNPVEPGH